jgi:hypothetical protein
MALTFYFLFGLHFVDSLSELFCHENFNFLRARPSIEQISKHIDEVLVLEERLAHARRVKSLPATRRLQDHGVLLRTFQDFEDLAALLENLNDFVFL